MTDINLAWMLVHTARTHPHLPALASGGSVRHDYRALAGRAACLARGMRVEGLREGDRVALVSRNSVEYIEALYACWYAGACAVPVNSKLHPDELDYVLDHSGSRWALVDAAWRDALGTRLASPAPERVVELGSIDYERLVAVGADNGPGAPAAVTHDTAAWLFYTSGTTGRPKGAVLTHRNLRAMSQAFVEGVEAIAPGDALLHPAPLSHGSGLYVIPHVAAAAINVVPQSGGFDPAELATLIARWPGSAMFAAPTMLKRLVAHPSSATLELSHLKCIVCGGAPLYVEDCKQALARLGPRIAQIFGQGESPMTITGMRREEIADAAARGDDARLGSVGRALPGVLLRIAGDDDGPVATGEIGEVLVRGPTVMREYWRNPDASAVTLADGWLHTGDIGAVDAAGYLTLRDRSKDVIISGGSNIYPREVEEVLQRHGDVREVAVIGRHHDDWGEQVVACVVARARADLHAMERELDALCLAHIARFKRPSAYVFLDELPKNNTGKVLKTKLRALTRSV